MKIYPDSDPADFLDIEICEEDKNLCSISIMVTPIGISCSYLNLQEVEQLQKELSDIIEAMRENEASGSD